MKSALRRTLPVAILAIAAAMTVPAAAHAASAYYVSPSGSDSADGSQSAPWKTIAHAQSAASAGDTVYFRAGSYSYTTATTSCASQTAVVDAITLSKSGVSYVNYPAEKVQ